MELKDVLLKLKTENGFTTEQLSQRSGVPKGTLNKLLNGETRNPTGATLKKLAGALNCPVELLYSQGEDSIISIRNAEDILPVHRRALPLLGEVAAGVPIYADEQLETAFCDESLSCDFALRVRGDSMTGARIHDGDIVFIRSQEDVDDGDIAVVLLNDEATLKRVFKLGDRVILRAENPAYAPFEYSAHDGKNLRVLGKAIAFQGQIR